MENLYNHLGCDVNSSPKTIRQAFQRLAKELHPDKTPSTLTEEFIKVKRAYDILNDPDLKKQYDACWLQEQQGQEWPIQDQVDIEEFYDGVYPCRCGGQYELSPTDQMFKMTYVICNTCSLCIQVFYTKKDKC